LIWSRDSRRDAEAGDRTRENLALCICIIVAVKKRASEEVMDIGIFVFESDSSLDPAVLARRAEELVWSGITGPFISIRIHEQTSSLA
jgi:hypothetical protein